MSDHRLAVLLESFADLVEGKRSLDVSVSTGMIHLTVKGLAIAIDFRLDSEDVERFNRALLDGRALVGMRPGMRYCVACHKTAANAYEESMGMYCAESGNGIHTWNQEGADAPRV